MMYFDLILHEAKFNREAHKLESSRMDCIEYSRGLLENFKQTVLVLAHKFKVNDEVGEFFFYLCVSLECMSDQQLKMYIGYLRSRGAIKTANFILHCIKLIHTHYNYSEKFCQYSCGFEDWEEFALKKKRVIRAIIEEEFNVLVSLDEQHDNALSKQCVFFGRVALRKKK